MPTDFIQFVNKYESLEISATNPILSTSDYPVLFFYPTNSVDSPNVARVYSEKIAEIIGEGHRRGLHPVSAMAGFIQEGGLERLARDFGVGDREEIIEISDKSSIYHLLRRKDYEKFVLGEEIGLMAYLRLTDLSLNVSDWVAQNNFENSRKMRRAVEKCRLSHFHGKKYHNCSMLKDVSKEFVREFQLNMRDVEDMGKILPPIKRPSYSPELALAYA